MVYLVGAGPYDYKLISVRGMELIKKAEVIIYDRLVNRRLLDFGKDGALLVHAGKNPGGGRRLQDDVNRLVAEYGSEYKVVVRLKAGDPFVLSNGGEEAIFLHSQGIPFEIVPGVSSLYSAPAYCGIPVTHRGISSSVSVFSGDDFDGTTNIPFEKIAKIGGTLIFFVGVKHIEYVVNRLIEHGMYPKTTAALVYRGTSYTQKEIYGTLSDIVIKSKVVRLKNPTMLIVGEVVNLRYSVNWVSNRPLWGKRIALIETHANSASLADELYDLGATCIILPTIKQTDSDYEQLDNVVDNIDSTTHLLFTNAGAVFGFFKRVLHSNKDTRILHGKTIIALGERTRDALWNKGINADIYAPHYIDLETVLKGKIPEGQQVLALGSGMTRRRIEKYMAQSGVPTKIVHAYESVTNDCINPAALDRIGMYDYIIFRSAFQVERLMSLTTKKIRRPVILAVGESADKACAAHGLNSVYVDERLGTEGIIKTILGYCSLPENSIQINLERNRD